MERTLSIYFTKYDILIENNIKYKINYINYIVNYSRNVVNILIRLIRGTIT